MGLEPHQSEAARGLTDKLIGALPSQFLMLLILNVVFVGFLLLILREQASDRKEMLSRVIDKCVSAQPYQPYDYTPKRPRQDGSRQDGEATPPHTDSEEAGPHV